VFDLVSSWGFPLMATKLYDQLIDEENFENLERDDVKILAKDLKLGYFLKFWKRYSLWKQNGLSTNSRSQQNIPEGEEQKSENEFKINVARLLNDCAEGKMIINNYKSHRILSDSLRTKDDL
jgi:hypothetical protein